MRFISISLPLAVLLVPAFVSAQSWEIAARHVTIDDRAPYFTSSGLGVVARHVLESGLSVELEFSRGADDQPGAICGGLISEPGECVPEIVDYSGGLIAFGLGRRFRIPIGSALTVGVRPRVGLGAVWISERGRTTSRTYHALHWSILGGGAMQAAYRVTEGFFVTAGLAADYLRPFQTACDDCGDDVRNAMPTWNFGVGVGWGAP